MNLVGKLRHSLALRFAAAGTIAEPAVVSREHSGRAASRLVIAATVLLYMLTVVQNAWLCDDAFVAFRAAANAVHGHGLVSNPGERVQAFTSPLWTLIFAAGYTVLRSAYTLALVLSVSCSLAAALVLVLGLKAPLGARAFALVSLSGSMAYAHYSTSGLENPLSHLLLAIFAVGVVNGTRPRLLWCVSGLIMLTRLDHALLVLPALVSCSWGRPLKTTLRDAALGWSPLILWEIFAVIYYGFPFPNTAYAKLNTTLPGLEVAGQGFAYVVDATLRDPVTPVMLLLGMLAPFIVGFRRSLGLATGVFLYVAYVVRVGGDFMAGRFLAAPLLVSVVLISGVVLARVRLREQLVVVGLFVAVALVSPGLPLKREKPNCIVPPTGIVDERGCYVERTGIALNLRKQLYKEHQYFQKGRTWRKSGDPVVVSMLVGMAGFAAGPDVHIIDPYALTDPFLARLPFAGEQNWRVGHFRRDLPPGYLETVRSGSNQLVDPCLRAYYDSLARVVRGPIFTTQRFHEIFRLNFGAYDHLVQQPCRTPQG